MMRCTYGVKVSDKFPCAILRQVLAHKDIVTVHFTVMKCSKDS